MAMVAVDGSSLQADSQPVSSLVGSRVGSHVMLSLHYYYDDDNDDDGGYD